MAPSGKLLRNEQVVRRPPWSAVADNASVPITLRIIPKAVARGRSALNGPHW
jgi:hypothetical protein